MTSAAERLVALLEAHGDPTDASAKAAYLKAEPGGYGEGDTFVGVRVPQVRAIARDAKREVALEDIEALLQSPIHEARLLAAILLVELYKPKRTSAQQRERIVRIVLEHAERFNNWDLVDTVAPATLGAWLYEQPTAEQDTILDALAASPVLWRRRMAMVCTLGLMRAGDLRQVIRLAHKLIDDPEDLMHKAVGWMLREAGARDRPVVDEFLNAHAATMPRTALRYALEKYDKAQRAHYLALRAG